MEGLERADLAVAFFRHSEELERRLAPLARLVFPDGKLWVAWPRRAAGHVSNLTDQSVREVALGMGLVDTKVAAIDEDWTGLRLVWRRENRGQLRL